MVTVPAEVGLNTPVVLTIVATPVPLATDHKAVPPTPGAEVESV